MKEHKQLLISPVILFILAMPRLILSLISGCVDPLSKPWLFHFLYTTNAYLCRIYSPIRTLYKDIERRNYTMVTTNSSKTSI